MIAAVAFEILDSDVIQVLDDFLHIVPITIFLTLSHLIEGFRHFRLQLQNLRKRNI